MSYRPIRLWLTAVALAALTVVGAAKAADGDVIDVDAIDFKIVPGDDAVGYAPGDEMKITFKVDFKGQDPAGHGFSLGWNRDGDDGKNEEGKFPITADGEEHTITTTIDKPGFVRIRARILDGNDAAVGKQAFTGGMGAGIDQLQSVPEPADFDEFWAKQKERLAAVPLNADRQLLKTDGGCHIYSVKIDCVGDRPATGYVTIPVDAPEKSLPIFINFQGYNVPTQRAPGGYPRRIQFYANAHGVELDQPQGYYAEFFEKIKSNGHSYAFDPVQNADPETAYFNGMVLRDLRALEYLKSLPEWNGKDLIVEGISQGGMQCIWAAGLDPDVSGVTAQLPWGCDMAGHKVLGRLGGWFPEWVEALGYYDATHHAKRVKGGTTIAQAGLADYTCPPSGIAILYNNLPAPKKIIWVQGRGHSSAFPGAPKFIREDKGE